MKNERRKFIRWIGLGGLAAVVPSFSLFGSKTSGVTTTLINHVLVHIPTGRSVVEAHEDVERWTNVKGYYETLSRLKRDGRLIEYSVTTDSSTFRIQLQLASKEDRSHLIEALNKAAIFDDSKRIELGYRISEYIQIVSKRGRVLKTETVRQVA